MHLLLCCQKISKANWILSIRITNASREKAPEPKNGNINIWKFRAQPFRWRNMAFGVDVFQLIAGLSINSWINAPITLCSLFFRTRKNFIFHCIDIPQYDFIWIKYERWNEYQKTRNSFQNKRHKLSTFINPCVDMEKYFWHIRVLINGGKTIATTKFPLFICSHSHPLFHLFYLIEWFDLNTRFIFHQFQFIFLFHRFHICFFFRASFLDVDNFLHHIKNMFAFTPCHSFHCTFHTVCDEHCLHK